MFLGYRSVEWLLSIKHHMEIPLQHKAQYHLYEGNLSQVAFVFDAPRDTRAPKADWATAGVAQW